MYILWERISPCIIADHNVSTCGSRVQLQMQNTVLAKSGDSIQPNETCHFTDIISTPCIV